MTVVVTHATVTGAVADPTALVDGPAWDARHTVTGLENVDNTSDANKPISTATQAALDLKQPLDSDLTAIAALTTATYGRSLLTLTANPAISVHRNGTAQTAIAPATFTKLAFTNEEFDTNSNFDNATNYRFTPTVAGKYLVTLAATLANMPDAKFMALSIEKNGSRFKDVLAPANGTTVDCGTSITALIDFNGSSDYVEGFIFHNNGSNLDVYGNTNLTFMTAARVAT